MTQPHVPLLVLTDREDNVELINRTLRDAGHPARCQWVQRIDALAEALEQHDPELLWFFPDGSQIQLRDVAKVRQQIAPMVPLVVVTSTADEASIARAMEIGAQDLVSIAQLERLRAVAARELRTYRLERALNS